MKIINEDENFINHQITTLQIWAPRKSNATVISWTA